MYRDVKILGLIPARGGSKGIKDKNICHICGKPLISYTIEAANTSKYLDDVVVTTNDPKIADTARAYGASVPFMRPEELARDTSLSIEALMHAIHTLHDMGKNFDVVLFLQPTSPLRTSADIDASIEEFFKMRRQSLASVSPVRDHPLLMRTVGADGCLTNMLNQSSTCRRQDMPPYYRVNGAIYIYNVAELSLNTSLNDALVPYIMEKSHAVDIDNLGDICLAEYYLNNAIDTEPL